MSRQSGSRSSGVAPSSAVERKDGVQLVRNPPEASAATPQSRPPLNQCSICGLDFGSLRAFDAHRIGNFDHEYSPEHPDGRRCLSEHELEGAGFTRNARGRWSLSRDLDRARSLAKHRPRTSDG